MVVYIAFVHSCCLGVCLGSFPSLSVTSRSRVVSREEKPEAVRDVGKSMVLLNG